MTNSIDDLSRLVGAVKAAGADIAPGYAEYVQLAFAVSTDCGEAGRAGFITLCSLSAKYNAAHAEKLYTNALRQGHRTVHLGTAFHLAAQAGVTLALPAPESYEQAAPGAKLQSCTGSFPHTRACTYNTAEEEGNPGEGETLTEGSEPLVHLPVFPQDYPWPKLLQDIIAYGDTPEQRDVLLLAAVGAIGASLGPTVRCLYSRRWFYPCLQLFVIAPPASGKGVLSWVRKLVEPIHDDIRSSVKEHVKQYRKELAAYNAMGREKQHAEQPQEPKNSMFIISGNNTGTGILQNLIDSDGKGIIFETEADTISSAIGGDYGHWSDTLRNTFDHTGVSYNRRTDREYREVNRTFLSVVLSGTPAQVAPLIPSAENGLFSRELFYYMPAVREWRDQFDVAEVDADLEFTRMGRQWKRVADDLKCRGVFTLRLTLEQRTAFNRHFSRIFRRAGLVNGQEMNSSVVRLAINSLRILEVVSMLRALECPELQQADAHTASDNLKDGIIARWDVTVVPEDFEAVLSLSEPLYMHATHILSFLPATEVKRRSMADRDRLLAGQPAVFTYRQWQEAADREGIPENTAKSWLRRLVVSGAAVRTEERGVYHKNDL